LDPETKKKEAKRMAVYAAMVEAMDFHIGRLIDFLEKSNALENTMIIFLSDNGAEGNDPRVILENRAWIPRNFDNSIENMGNFNSHISYGPKWAEVSASPYKGFKGFTSEGGIKSPAFITYKGFKRQKSINDAFLTVMDIAPTILEIANTEHPGEKYKERQVYPIKGKSMINFLMNERNSIHTENHVMGWELFNRIAIRRGNWKLVFIEPPHGNQKWSLYDLSQDPLEQNDLADIKSEILKEMISHWYTYRDQNGVIIDNDMRLGYSGSNSHYDH
jgi:arylsulfatase